MNRIKAGVVLILMGWFIGILSPVISWINFFNEKIDLNSGYEMTRAEIVLNEADFEAMTGYQKVTLKYMVNEELIESVMTKEEYINQGYHPFVNGGLVNVMYDTTNPNSFKIVTDQRIVANTIRFIVVTLITIYILKNIYPEVVMRHKKEFKTQKYIDAKIISSDHLNRIIAMEEHGEKVRIFKSFPFFNESNNMGVFLKSKNIDKIRVYFDEFNKNKIVMDYNVLSEVKSND